MADAMTKTKTSAQICPDVLFLSKKAGHETIVAYAAQSLTVSQILSRSATNQELIKCIANLSTPWAVRLVGSCTNSPMGSELSVMMTSNVFGCCLTNSTPSWMWMCRFGFENPTAVWGRYCLHTSMTFCRGNQGGAEIECQLH